MFTRLTASLALGVAVTAGLGHAYAAAADDQAKDQAKQEVQELIDGGLAFLKSQQAEDGAWMSERGAPAYTALALKAFVQEPAYSTDDDFVKKGYDALLGFQLADGGIYEDLLANYNTAIALTSLVAAEDEDFAPQIEDAVRYLKRLQWTTDTIPEHDDEQKGTQIVQSVDDAFYGGWGYGGRSRGAGRPDLSNTHWSIEALRDAGVPENDPAVQRAVAFVTRLQNNAETNPQPWAGNDGGFIYSPNADRTFESFAGEFVTPDGERRLRSYGSMTYAGYKSMIHAGLTPEDPRVAAAREWVANNWTLDVNPGMQVADPEKADWGLYYYYHTLARALNVGEVTTIQTPTGEVDWRVEFISKMADLQREDGSWNGDKKWMEDDPVLVTSYVVLALQEARQSLEGE
ncbi:MAG: prenyltransferase/squalene oxidase repeat-containing protein [Phycisphaerae bacterium]